MDYLPIFMQMHGRNALIIGGGVIASRKAALVQKSGANIHVVSPELSPAMQKLIAKNGFKYSIANYDSEFLDNKHLVIAATDNDEVNQQVFQDTNQRGIPCNVADKTELCSFILPAIVDRDPVVIAISTGGRSPVLARYIKARIETFIPTAFGKLADLLGRFRERVKTVVGNDRERRRFWEDVIDGAIGETVLSGNHKVAQQLLENEVDRYKDKVTDLSSRIGEVYLIGAGPGDPDLLTFRAQRLLQKADVVLYDRLVPSGIFELCRREAEMVYVGKRRDQHTIPQEELSKLLVRYARAGKSVARLKGGDPFVFGRGGEEIQELAKEGIPFQVVPGISAANGCAAYSGIPLTHREYASGVSFYTAHRKAFASDGNTDSNESILTLNWSKMIDEHHTSVFFMGLGTLKDICSNLIKHGLPDSFPAAMVAHGTTQAQKIEVGSLATLPTQVEQAGLTSPALLIVGKVVLLREELNWYASEYSGLKDGSEIESANGSTNNVNFAGQFHRTAAEKQRVRRL